jgi:uncharacterized protein YndB with AHSA1/START domain
MEKIIIEVMVHAPRERVWESFTTPTHIEEWNHASDDWECTNVINDLRVGGRLSSRMAAKDGSAAFEFGGVYTAVIPHERLAFTMDDGRNVALSFTTVEESTHVVETFDPETENPLELQREGWQAILDSFKRHTEQAV